MGWQGVTVPNAHGGQQVTAIAASSEHTPDQQVRFLTGGRDNRIVLWDGNIFLCDHSVKKETLKEKQLKYLLEESLI